MTRKQKEQEISSVRLQDPYLEREKAKYDQPLPSREYILSLLAAEGVPVYAEELAQLLEITHKEIPFFERRLGAMARDGEILINRKGAVCIAEKAELIKCRVSGHRDGFGFAVPEETDGKGDLFLPEREMRKAFHGDIAMVRPVGVDRRGRREGRIVEVLERAVSKLVARIHRERGVWLARPEERRIRQDILIEAGGEGKAKEGQVVVVEILEQPDGQRQPIGRVAEVLGDYADPGMEIEIALRKHDLPHVFPDEVLKQKIPAKVRKKDLKGRVDLRDLPLVTIDGETARDFDDAVYAERSGKKGFRLIVAIADVSHYVEPGDALDQEAYNRGTSVYFPRRVIPMLPEALSNGICSLNPEVDRLCMVCDMQIGAKGQVKKYSFYPAVMHSKARLTYTQVWDWLQNGSVHPVFPHIQVLYELFKILLTARAQRGAIEFDTVETRMIFNDEGKIEKIVPVVRNDAHRLIEECMLAANVCASEFIQKNKRKSLYRVHEGPTQEKLENLRRYLAVNSLSLGGGEKPTTKDYAKLADEIKNRPDASMIQTMLLRSMQQAVYSPENLGHFGLAYQAYTHFTSPIRRYPDLLVHRTIKGILQDQPYKPGKWAKLGEHCSMTERRADDASRDVEAWLKTYYMRDKLGEVFNGKISAVTSFGVFVLLDELFVEGLLHISELGKDYFHYKQELQAIIGEKSGLRYQLGDALRVKVARVDLEATQVDFVLVKPEDEDEKEEAKPASASTRRRKPVAEKAENKPEAGAQAPVKGRRTRKPRS
jgi:ribonuclease R